MPSKFRQLWRLFVHIVVWLVWIPMAGSLRHNRTYGELKRLRFRDAGGLLIPIAFYVTAGAWIYVFFPRDLLPWAGLLYAAAILAGGSLIMSTVVVNRVVVWRHRLQ